MTITIPARIGTFDGVAPSPCGPVMGNTSLICTEFCAAQKQASYANGELCPLNQDIELYTDDFSSYSIGGSILDPPWTQMYESGFGAGHLNAVWHKEISGANPVAQFNPQGGLNGFNATFAKVYNQGYAGFNSGPCGVWIQCILDSVAVAGGHNVAALLSIGVNDARTTTKNMWVIAGIHANATGSVGQGQGPDASFGTTFYTTTAPVAGDKLKLKLTRTGAFGWRLEAYINDVLAGSSASSLIQLTHASPKSLAFIGITNANGLPASDIIKIRDVRMGVC